ncbi:hypothetical protein Ancab_020472 [Ancistrocladus abbreviatus]
MDRVVPLSHPNNHLLLQQSRAADDDDDDDKEEAPINGDLLEAVLSHVPLIYLAHCLLRFEIMAPRRLLFSLCFQAPQALAPGSRPGSSVRFIQTGSRLRPPVQRLGPAFSATDQAPFRSSIFQL